MLECVCNFWLGGRGLYRKSFASVCWMLFGCIFLGLLYDFCILGDTPGYERSFTKMFVDAEKCCIKECVGKIDFGVCVV